MRPLQGDPISIGILCILILECAGVRVCNFILNLWPLMVIGVALWVAAKLRTMSCPLEKEKRDE